MSEIKKAFIGGYKKSAVDEVINALNEKLEKAEADEKQILRKLDNSESKIAELEGKIAELQFENERLEKTNKDNQNVFGDIARVYKRAYNAGYDIVSESKDTTVNFLSDIYNRFDDSLEDTETTLAKYDDIKSGIDKALSSLNEGLRDIADSTSMILDKARSFSGLYGQMKDIMLSAMKDSEKSLKEYEDYSSEFTAVRETAEDGIPSDEPAGAQIADEYPAESVTQTAEPSAQAPVTEDTESKTENISQADAIADITESEQSVVTAQVQTPAEPVTADIPAEPTAPVEPDTHTKPDTLSEPNAHTEQDTHAEQDTHTETAHTAEPTVHAETAEPAEPDTHTEPIVSTETAVHAEPVVIVASAVQALRNESATAHPAPAQVQSDRSAEFTQFGRKTKVSPEDRSELIRKALMRNGGN